MTLINTIRHHDRIARRCRRAISALPQPATWDLTGIAAALARRRGRRIEIMPWPIAPHLPSGWLLRTEHADVIVHDASSGRTYAQQTIAHELGHLVLHLPPRPCVDDLADAATVAEQLAAVRRDPRADGWTHDREGEAETFGALLLAHLHHHAARPVRLRRDLAGSWAA